MPGPILPATQSSGSAIVAANYNILQSIIQYEITRRGLAITPPAVLVTDNPITDIDWNSYKSKILAINSLPVSNSAITALTAHTVASPSSVAATDFNLLLNALATLEDGPFSQILTFSIPSTTNVVINNTFLTSSPFLTSSGWGGTVPFTATIVVTGVVGSTSTGTYALSIAGSYPATSTINIIINSGAYIVGAGGNGSADGGNGGAPTTPGSPGGPAMHIAAGTGATIYVTNNGVIGGGGGGGGSSGGCGGGAYDGAASSGGGGAGSIVGTSAYPYNLYAGYSWHASAGNPGTLTTGGGSTYVNGWGSGTFAEGGQGGNLGSPGTAGVGANWANSDGGGKPGGNSGGGAAGAATLGHANATWSGSGPTHGTLG